MTPATTIPASLLTLFQKDFARYLDELETLTTGAEAHQSAEFWSRVQEKLDGVLARAQLIGMTPLANRLATLVEACDQQDQLPLAQAEKQLMRMVAAGRALIKRLSQQEDLAAWHEAMDSLLDNGFEMAHGPAKGSPSAALSRSSTNESTTAAPATATAQPQPLSPSGEGLLRPPPSEEGERVQTNAPMMELFHQEAETQGTLLSDQLLDLEDHPTSPAVLETLMRAAHSFKGAARMVGLEEVTLLAHKLEDCFVAAQQGKLILDAAGIDQALAAVDVLRQAARRGVHAGQPDDPALKAATAALEQVMSADGRPAATTTPSPVERSPSSRTPSPGGPQTDPGLASHEAVRVTAETLNRMIALSQENKNSTAWLRQLARSLLDLKRRQHEVGGLLSRLGESLQELPINDLQHSLFRDLKRLSAEARDQLSERLNDLEDYDRRVINVSTRLNQAVLSSRMRPFGDTVHGMRRMVRDLARITGKRVRIEIRGLNTQVDRDVLEKLEAPINHLLRNAVDHGLETPEQRTRCDKPAEGMLLLRAGHNAGTLTVTVEDDGGGIDTESIRRQVVEKGLMEREAAAELETRELYDFLFKPAFSTRSEVSEISGRGVGLDVVRTMVEEVSGNLSVHSEPGRLTRFTLQLPLTRSVMRSLLVRIANELYAFPLARVDRVFYLEPKQVQRMGNQCYISLPDLHLGLIRGRRLLGMSDQEPLAERQPVVVIGQRRNRYGIGVDQFVGEQNLIVLRLDPQLGRVPNVSAAAILETGEPVLILDVDDILRSIDQLLLSGGTNGLHPAEGRNHVPRVLLVDDSVIVREMVRSALEARGFKVDMAFDGEAGWVRAGKQLYDLVITDYEMPRMDGIELAGRIKAMDNYMDRPLILFTTRDEPEVRNAALTAGADYFVIKSKSYDELFSTIDKLFNGN